MLLGSSIKFYEAYKQAKWVNFSVFTRREILLIPDNVRCVRYDSHYYELRSECLLDLFVKSIKDEDIKITFEWRRDGEFELEKLPFIVTWEKSLGRYQ